VNPSNPETVIAVMQKDIEYIKVGISKIEQSVKEMGGVFVTSLEFVDYKKQAEENAKKVSMIERNMWMGLGALSVISLGLKFFIP